MESWIDFLSDCSVEIKCIQSMHNAAYSLLMRSGSTYLSFKNRINAIIDNSFSSRLRELTLMFMIHVETISEPKALQSYIDSIRCFVVQSSTIETWICTHLLFLALVPDKSGRLRFMLSNLQAITEIPFTMCTMEMILLLCMCIWMKI